MFLGQIRMFSKKKEKSISGKQLDTPWKADRKTLAWMERLLTCTDQKVWMTGTLIRVLVNSLK
jgi:hypothetical protein